MAVLLPFVVPESNTRAAGRFDYAGAALLTSALSAVLLAISRAAPGGGGVCPPWGSRLPV